jgi:glyoxylase-like metal-dependent hydrolase (beta-lactamase superfamily II)
MTQATSPVIRVANQGVAANTYLCRTAMPGACILVDPGLDRGSIETALARTELTPRAIFCTHGHFDHVGSAEHFSRKYDIEIHMHEGDTRLARSANFTMMALKMPWRIEVPRSVTAIDEGTVWTGGDSRVEVIHVPGHTPGSLVLLIDGRAFTGDTLYRQGVWLGSMPESDHTRLVASLHRLWAMLPEDMPVYPGHGRSADFGVIRRQNTPLLELLGLAGSAEISV